MSAIDPLEQAIQAVKSGEIAHARALLTQVLSADPQQAQAWFWLAACWSEPEKQRFCLEKAAELRPDDPQIRQALDRFTEQHGPQREPAPLEGDFTAFPAQQGEAEADADLTPLPTAERSTPAAESPGELAEGSLPEQPAKISQPLSAAQLPQAPRPHRESRRDSRRHPAQTGALILLSLLALASLLVLSLVIFQTDLPGLLFGQMRRSAGKVPVVVPVFQMEPTWTPTPALAPSPTLVHPTTTPLPTAPPVASLTPHYGDWRLQIGRSVRERPIEVYRFGTGPHERLIVAGIHGGSEAITIALADQMIEHLKENPRLVPAEVSLYILRSLNPDGEALYDRPLARYNANGVDLNRNFGTNWKPTWSAQGCDTADTNTAGREPASEPETKAFVKFLSTRKIEALINYHSGGKGVFPAGSPAEPASVRLAKRIAAVSEYPYPPPDTGCQYTGTLVDWAASQGVPAAVDLELASKIEMDLAVNLKILELLLNWQP